MELRYWWELGDLKHRNTLTEWKAFVDAVGIKGADLKNEFCHRQPQKSRAKIHFFKSAPCSMTTFSLKLIEGKPVEKKYVKLVAETN